MSNTEKEPLKEGTKIYLPNEDKPFELDKDYTEEEFLEWLRNDDSANSEVTEEHLERNPDGSVSIKKQKIRDLG